MTIRLVLLHGWGANGDDLRPLGEQLAQRTSAPLETICLEAPERHPGQPGGRQWYGLFPSDWDAVPEAVNRLRSTLLTLEGGEAALRQTVLFGFSQGGAMALDCGCSLPLAGIISCSGYAHPAWSRQPVIRRCCYSMEPKIAWFLFKPWPKSRIGSIQNDVKPFHFRTVTPSL